MNSHPVDFEWSDFWPQCYSSKVSKIIIFCLSDGIDGYGFNLLNTCSYIFKFLGGVTSYENCSVLWLIKRQFFVSRSPSRQHFPYRSEMCLMEHIRHHYPTSYTVHIKRWFEHILLFENKGIGHKFLKLRTLSRTSKDIEYTYLILNIQQRYRIYINTYWIYTWFSNYAKSTTTVVISTCL